MTQFVIDDIIKNALIEDINYKDVATDNLIDENHMSKANFVSKDDGVVCGILIAKRVFELIDEDVDFKVFFNDGERVKKGDIIASFSCKTRAVLKGERVALNLLCHLSGIASKTRRCVDLVEGRCKVADTRKTLPNLRPLQKWAVTVGGGINHRYNLSDMVMLKDNHIDAYGSITNAVKAVKEKISFATKIEVEARTMADLKEAISAGADIVMLDNMTNAQMKECCDYAKGKVILEASGNVTEENIAEVSKTGVDIISLGALTHSVIAFDISLKIQRA